ncbi:MAG: hypothetical protein IPM54_24025 [Polyangiaceae bacterium]|nr:hypothetical protein [Polyangiaceae bacterium]
MKRTNTWGALGLVVAMGMAVPGCFLFGANDEEVRWEVCASPIESRTHCVSASSGPGAAWERAAANGAEPIEMWVERADGTPLDEWVSSPMMVDAYINVVEEVLDYLRVTQRNAESYHASLAGKLGRDLERARRLQEKIIADTSVDPKTRIQKTLLDKGAKEKDPLKAEIAADKQTMGDVQAVIDAAKVDAGPFASQYKALVDDFVTYRATESSETTAYSTLAQDASNASLVELDAIEVSIVDAAHTASAKPNEFLVTGMKLSAQILQFEKTSREAISPHTDFMSSHGAVVPDMSSGALRSIHAMLGYAQQRVARSDATAKGLLLGVGMRRQALQLLADAPSPARATIANALLAKASTKFENAAQARVDAIAVAMSTSGKLGLPYLAKRYDEFAALLQMAPLCNTATSSWREAGCVSMRPKFKDATTYLKKTLPAEISQGLVVMKSKGVDAAVIARVQKKLDVGDIKGAALAHDELLRSTEGT